MYDESEKPIKKNGHKGRFLLECWNAKIIAVCHTVHQEGGHFRTVVPPQGRYYLTSPHNVLLPIIGQWEGPLAMLVNMWPSKCSWTTIPSFLTNHWPCWLAPWLETGSKITSRRHQGRAAALMPCFCFAQKPLMESDVGLGEPLIWFNGVFFHLDILREICKTCCAKSNSYKTTVMSSFLLQNLRKHNSIYLVLLTHSTS